MKKTLIIVGSVILVIILLGGAWWYLLMNGAPESLSSTPNPFGSFGTDSEEFATTTTAADTEEPRTSDGSFRKISASPVAGAVIFSRDGVPYVRYVERGTGHIFEVNPATGATERITGTTIPRATRAIWSPQGLRVVLITEAASDEERIFAGTIERTDSGEGTLTTIELENTARNIAFSSTGESVYYTTPTAGGSTGYEHNLKTNVRTVRFSSALRDIVVTWEPVLLAYTTPSAEMRGYAHTGTSFVRLLGGARGLMVVPTASHRVVSYAENDSLISRTDTFNGTALSIPVFPEKCAAGTATSTSATLYCGAPLALAPGAYPDVWYQGAVSFDDSIWKLDVETGSATLLSIPSEDAGEAVDIIDMRANDAGTMLIFINKKDGALWLQKNF